MSSYIVSENVIHDVITTMRPALMSGDDAASAFGRELFKMNDRSVSERYGQNGKDFDDYQFAESKDQTEAQLLKSLNCFIYQCEDADNHLSSSPYHDLYKRCSKHVEVLTDALARGQQLRFGQYRPFVPGYEEATWNR